MFRAAAVAVVLLALVCAQPVAAVAVVDAPVQAPASADTPVDAPASSDPVRATATADAPAVAAAASPTIEVDTALSLTPDRPGSIGVAQTFEAPDEVTDLRVTLDPESTVTEADGFSNVEDGTWAWDGETDGPQLRYEMAANRTTDREGPLGVDGSYLYADVGEWALVRQSNVGLQWRYRGADSISVDRSTRVDGEGAVGEVTAFLGPHEAYTRQVAGQEIRLIVPDDAELADPPERVLDGLGNASRELYVGDRDPTVFAVAAPADRVDWAVQGVQVGDSDFWVRSNQPIDGIGSTWIHEYVHTRQAFQTADSGRWLTEASATWYAALLSHELEGASFSALSRYLERGTASPQSTSVLADPGDWANDANYWKGALVSGEVDRRLRLATDGGATLQRVLAALNDRTSPITNDDVFAAVAEVGTEATRDTAEGLTTTSDVPDVWDRSAHGEAFGGDAARVRVSFDPASDVRATGSYRNATLSDPVALATGETLSVRTAVENRGGAAGEYAVTMRVDDDAVDTANGTLDPDESTTASLSHRFAEPGQYTVSVAGERLTVRVRESATPSVSDVHVEPTTVERGDEVTVTATLTNDESVPGNATVTITRDAEPVTTRTITVGPGARETITANVTMHAAGDHRVGVDDRAVDVHVDERRDETEAGTRATTPGFGAPVAILGLLAAIGLLGRDFGG